MNANGTLLTNRVLDESVCFGGIVATRRAFIDAMRADGHDPRTIDGVFGPSAARVQLNGEMHGLPVGTDEEGVLFLLSPVTEPRLPGGETVPAGAAAPVALPVLAT